MASAGLGVCCPCPARLQSTPDPVSFCNGKRDFGQWLGTASRSPASPAAFNTGHWSRRPALTTPSFFFVRLSYPSHGHPPTTAHGRSRKAARLAVPLSGSGCGPHEWRLTSNRPLDASEEDVSCRWCLSSSYEPRWVRVAALADVSLVDFLLEENPHRCRRAYLSVPASVTRSFNSRHPRGELTLPPKLLPEAAEE